jgi:hypothetical protein
MKKSLKQQAVDLRKDGWSYNIIAEQLKVAKSSLSGWLAEIPYQPNEEVQKRIKTGPLKSGINSHNQKLASIQKTKSRAALELGKFTKRDLWMIGIGLYISEGTKTFENVRVINSDPNVILLALFWFKNICKVPIKNFSLAVHLYPDTSINETINFWSKITGIPSSQFSKCQIDKRLNKSQKKERILPYGTAHLSIKSCGKPEFGVLLHRRIMGWIQESFNQVRGYSLMVKHLPSKEKSRVRFPLPAPSTSLSNTSNLRLF